MDHGQNVLEHDMQIVGHGLILVGEALLDLVIEVGEFVAEIVGLDEIQMVLDLILVGGKYGVDARLIDRKYLNWFDAKLLELLLQH
jgi:hypothetical protein